MTSREALRKEMRRIRQGLAPMAAAAAEAVADHISSLPFAPYDGSIVAVYRAMGSEIMPGPLAARLAGLGAQIALPVVVAKDTPLGFQYAEGEPPQAGEVRPDLVFVPLLAFDRNGGRLGQGGGYYDRTLSMLRRTGPVIAIGLAFAAQEVAQVPLEPHDEPLDGVLTEEGYRATVIR